MAGKVTVTIHPGAILIDPWVPSLRAALSYSKKVKATKWPYKMTSEKKYMYTTSVAEDGRTVGLTYEGLWWNVLQHLRNSNIEPVWKDLRNTDLVPDMSKLQPLRPLQDGALAVLTDHLIGVIECPPGFGKSFLLTQLPRIYPDANIVMVTTRQAVVKDIFARAKAIAPDPKKVQLCLGGKKFPVKAKVVIITAGSIHKIPTDWPDLYIFDEVHGCATPRQILSLDKLTCRRYGLSASPDGRLDGADLEVTGMFGPVMCKITYQEAQAAGLVCPIRVHMIHINTDEPKAATDIKKQRLGYWQNVVRNRVIASAARKHGPEESVLILVKTLEHALFLRLLLPEFFIAHGGVASDEAGNKKWNDFCNLGLVADTPEFTQHIRNIDISQMKEMFADGRIKKVIATPCWREGVDFKSLSVLIRADGSGGSIDAIQIVGRLSRIFPGKEFGTLYDFIDDYGPSYLKKSQSRKKHYEKQGWSIREDGLS